ncbi:MAG: M14 metallopeptidase family protein [Ferruginibacter sp.]
MRICFFLLILFSGLCSSAQNLDYYLPDSITYDPAIPKPKDVIYHNVGEWHVTHDRLVSYMKALAQAAPQRIKLETMGLTYESRPQLLLIITSPANHKRLEEIRQQHLQLNIAAGSAQINIDRMPVVVWIGNSIHGNEPSGANAGLLTAYHLAAAQGKKIEDLLDNVVILFDPSFNPDGLQRFSTWVNQHKSNNLVSDPNNRELNEVWPGGRFNHYWFDLNRDWLPAVHIESQNRLKWFHAWRPNILTDHHEQGSNATFFFQPGVPSRVNPLTPAKNQELTAKLGNYHAAYLDKIGSLYFTKESYDDFYYGKGSTFPDAHGGIGILFEQASSRGHSQETNNGILTFPATIKNQFVTSLSTLEGAYNLRKEFLNYQREFYQQAAQKYDSIKGYAFGEVNDKARTFHFVEMLQRHEIEVRRSADNKYPYMVSLQQPQQTLIRTIFEKQLSFKDSIFYDITSWTMPLAFGLPYTTIKNTGINTAALIDKVVFPAGQLTGRSENAYLMEWNELYAPAALYELLKKDIVTKVSSGKFSININGKEKQFSQGTILIPVPGKEMSEKIWTTLQSLTGKYAVNIFPVQTGVSNSGSDLGSSRFAMITKPVIAMIVGQGVNATDAGEVWHLLDQRMNIPATHLDQGVFNRVDVNKYNTLIMVGGTYSDINKEKLKTWVQAGGNLILLEEAVTWASQGGINSVTFKKAKTPLDSTVRIPYNQREEIEGAQQVSGAIFGADADLTHPLAYGYTQSTVSLFKANKVYMEKSKNAYATPFYYKDSPLQSGWVSKQNYDAIKKSAAVVVNTLGSGRIINIADNPNFRAFWLGGTRLMMNAVFFGKVIDAGSARTE